MAECLPQLFVCAERFTRLNADGSLDFGPDAVYTTDALIIATPTAEIKEGKEIEVENACGNFCVNFKDCDRLKRFTGSLELCSPGEPELMALMTGGIVLETPDGQGYGAPRLNEATCPNGVSMELWAKRVDSTGTQDSAIGGAPWAWWVWPRVFFQHDSFNFEADANKPTFNFFAVENLNWGTGIDADWPVASDRVFQWVPTDFIPTPTCGFTAS